MKLLKILPIFTIAFLAASISISQAQSSSSSAEEVYFLHPRYASPEDSILFNYIQNYFTLCLDRQRNIRTKEAKDSLIKAIYYSVLSEDHSLVLHKCVGGGIEFAVSECKVEIVKNKLKLNILSEAENITTLVIIENGVAMVQEKFTNFYNDEKMASFCKTHQNDKKLKDVKCLDKIITYTIKDDFSDIDLNNLAHEIHCQCALWRSGDRYSCDPYYDE